MALIEPEHYEALFGPLKGRKSRMPDLKTLRRVTQGASEVMVKVTGYGRGSCRVGSHLAYISRHGKLEMENERGEILQGREELKDFISDWQADIESRPRRERQRDSAHLVLSMPAHVDAESVRNASREFAREMFGKNHEYVFALHTDEEHPHCHLAVKCRGHDGKWLNPRKADLQHWRDLFAEKLREEGVDAEATPRFTRGVTRKAERSAVRHMARGGRAHPPRVPDVVSAKRKETFKELMEEVRSGVGAPPRIWEEAIKSRQNRVRRAWLSAAEALEQATADTHFADKELPEAIRRFVSAMPSIDTERHLMKRELIQALTQKPEKHLAVLSAQAEIRDVEGDRANGISGAEKAANRQVADSRRPPYGQIGVEQPGRSRDQDLER